jgi:hypothetical protein
MKLVICMYLYFNFTAGILTIQILFLIYTLILVCNTTIFPNYECMLSCRRFVSFLMDGDLWGDPTKAGMKP